MVAASGTKNAWWRIRTHHEPAKKGQSLDDILKNPICRGSRHLVHASDTFAGPR